MSSLSAREAAVDVLERLGPGDVDRDEFDYQIGRKGFSTVAASAVADLLEMGAITEADDGNLTLVNGAKVKAGPVERPAPPPPEPEDDLSDLELPEGEVDPEEADLDAEEPPEEALEEPPPPPRRSRRASNGLAGSPAKRRPDFKERDCVVCGDEFKPNSGAQRTCHKPRCKREQAERRQREKAAEVEGDEPPPEADAIELEPEEEPEREEVTSAHKRSIGGRQAETVEGAWWKGPPEVSGKEFVEALRRLDVADDEGVRDALADVAGVTSALIARIDAGFDVDLDLSGPPPSKQERYIDVLLYLARTGKTENLELVLDRLEQQMGLAVRVTQGDPP